MSHSKFKLPNLNLPDIDVGCLPECLNNNNNNHSTVVKNISILEEPEINLIIILIYYLTLNRPIRTWSGIEEGSL